MNDTTIFWATRFSDCYTTLNNPDRWPRIRSDKPSRACQVPQ